MAILRALALSVVLAGCGACGAALDPPHDPGLRGLDLLEQERATVEVIACDSAGTGVIVSKRHVVTAFHVVAGCGLIVIRTIDGELRIATLEIAHQSDLARLIVLDDDLPDIRPYTGAVGMGQVVCFTAANPKRVRECGVVRIFLGDRKESGDARFGAKVVKGNSGSPVWREDGTISGIVVQCDLDETDPAKPKCAERGGGFTSLRGVEWLVESTALR